MVKIIPAVLPKSFSELEATLLTIKGIVSTVQVDIVDGIFAPNATWPYDEMGNIEFEKILLGERTLPHKDDFDFELDLMVDDALEAADKWVRVGASRLIIHAKSRHAKEALESLQGVRGEGRGLISLGVALPSGGKAEMFAPFRNLCDSVQVMGIEKVGFQGEPFNEQSLLLIQALHEEYPQLQISVDGGVRMENISKLVNAGATRLVAGSLILSSSNPKQKIHEIIELANHGTDRSKN